MSKRVVAPKMVALRTINTLPSFGHSFDYLDFVPVLNQATKKELLATTPCSSPSLSSRRKSSTVPRPVLRGSISQAPQASAAATPELYRSLLALSAQNLSSRAACSSPTPPKAATRDTTSVAAAAAVAEL